MCRQEIVDLLVGPSGIMVQVDTMASVRLNVGSESTGRREDRLGSRGNRLCGTTGSKAVTTTEGDILVAVDNVHGAGELVLGCHAGDSQEFTDGGWLLGRFGKVKKIGIEMARSEVEVHVVADVAASEISSAVV